MNRILALLVFAIGCAHPSPPPVAASPAASAHDKRHEAISLLEGMLGVQPIESTPTHGHSDQ